MVNTELPILLKDLIRLNDTVMNRKRRQDELNSTPLQARAATAANDDRQDLFLWFQIDGPLTITEAKPLIERDPESALDDAPDISDFQTESEMRQWLRDYQKKKIYIRPVVVYPSSVIRDLHEIYQRDDENVSKALF